MKKMIVSTKHLMILAVMMVMTISARSTYGRLPEQERQNFPKNELGF